MFQRKVYQKLMIWKEKYASKQACLIEGARQVGKTTIAEHFAQNEYTSYIKIDFANTTEEILDIFSNTAKLDLLFLRLQTETGIKLTEGESAIIFDQIQCNSKARNIAKDLVKDGRYHYIETADFCIQIENLRRRQSIKLRCIRWIMKNFCGRPAATVMCFMIYADWMKKWEI